MYYHDCAFHLSYGKRKKGGTEGVLKCIENMEIIQFSNNELKISHCCSLISDSGPDISRSQTDMVLLCTRGNL